MKRILVVATMGLLFGCAGMNQAPPARSAGEARPQPPAPEAPQPTIGGVPVAGEVPIGVTVVQLEAIFVGWSAQRDLLGKPVVNDRNEQVGKVDDLIIRPDNAVSYAIIGTGGFLGVAKHDVAIPMQQIQLQQDVLVLAGATREALKALPPFQYQRQM